MLDVSKIYLRDNNADAGPSFVEATLHPRLGSRDIIAAETSWGAARIDLDWEKLSHPLPGQTLQHVHWNWPQKVAHLLNHDPKIDRVTLAAPNDDVRFFGVYCQDDWQGLGMFEAHNHSDHEPVLKGRYVYIRFLESAPWNLKIPDLQEPRFSGVGSQLILAAIRFSLYSGLDGSVTLHSLPQALGFYERLGFARLEIDEKHEGLMAMELPSERALNLLAGKLE